MAGSSRGQYTSEVAGARTRSTAGQTEEVKQGGERAGAAADPTRFRACAGTQCRRGGDALLT